MKGATLIVSDSLMSYPCSCAAVSGCWESLADVFKPWIETLSGETAPGQTAVYVHTCSSVITTIIFNTVKYLHPPLHLVTMVIAPTVRYLSNTESCTYLELQYVQSYYHWLPWLLPPPTVFPHLVTERVRP